MAARKGTLFSYFSKADAKPAARTTTERDELTPVPVGGASEPAKTSKIDSPSTDLSKTASSTDLSTASSSGLSTASSDLSTASSDLSTASSDLSTASSSDLSTASSCDLSTTKKESTSKSKTAPKQRTKRQNVIVDDEEDDVEAKQDNEEEDKNIVVKQDDEEKDKKQDDEGNDKQQDDEDNDKQQDDEDKNVVPISDDERKKASSKRKTVSSRGRKRSTARASERTDDSDDDEDGDDGDSEPRTKRKVQSNSLLAHFTALGPRNDEEESAVPPAGELLPRQEAESEALLFEVWEEGSAVPYLALARTFEEIARISSRLKITEHLMRLFVEIIRRTPDDLLLAVYLSVNQLAPAYRGIELGVGESLIQKAICDATGRTMGSLKCEYDTVGDLGLIAQTSKSNQTCLYTPPRLTLRSVFRKFNDIARMAGHSSMRQKQGLVQQLLVAAQDCEPQFLVRSLQGKLRIGLAEKTVLTALAHAFVVARAERTGSNGEALDEAARLLRSVYAELPCYDDIVPALLDVGLAGLAQRCHLTTGIPVAPMLAHPTRGVGEVFERLGGRAFTCEYKYDGERAQIHRLPDGQLFIYSRNAENNTAKYPDIVAMLPAATRPGVESFIIDCEAVAIDLASGKLLPFQRLSTRARKEVSVDSIKVNVCLFAFDLLYLNGRSLLRDTLRQRRDALQQSFTPLSQQFAFAVSFDAAAAGDDAAIQSFLNESIDGQCEGLMIKTLDEAATYEPARRSYNWLKVKKDYLEGVADSLDLVPIGAVYGKGKRTGLYGAYLLACYDDDTEQYQAVTLIGTGFSDEELQQRTNTLKELVVPTKPPDYFVAEAPDVWFLPRQVWEVRVADLSLSDKYKGAYGVVEPGRGISLRFPRWIRLRDDKKPTQATSAEQLADLYRRQALVQGASAAASSSKANDASDDDFEF